MKEVVLILGGGLMQLPAIQAAGELGLLRHMADGNPACPGRTLVEHFHHVDLRDRRGLLELAQGISGLNGVFTAGTDFSRSVAYVAEHLGLPGITEDVAIGATDKAVMRGRLEAAGVSVPPHRLVKQDGELPPFGFPVIVKPVDNMGARGVVLVRSADEYAGAVKKARGLSPSGKVIVEQFIPGQEYSLDALIYDGNVRITGVGERHIFFSPYFVELGHTIPAQMAPEEQAVLEAEFVKAIHALGISRGAAKGDVFLHRDNLGRPKATIGEVAARLSGGFMSGWTYPEATGVPLTRLGLEISLGRSPSADQFKPTRHRVSAERALISGPGTVRAVTVPDVTDDEVVGVFVHVSPGDRVAPPRNNVEKAANVIVTSSTAAEASRRAAELLDEIRVYLEPDDTESEAFFFRDGWNARYCSYSLPAAAASRSGEAHESLAQSTDTTAAVDELHRASGGGEGPLRVCPPMTFSFNVEELENNQISISAATLLERLLSEDLIELNAAARVDGSRVFWRAFLAGGRQGVDHVFTTVRHSRMRP
ncbi:MAG: ATP-grasp domain-containing protein [Alkalispirochaeta sp.]